MSCVILTSNDMVASYQVIGASATYAVYALVIGLISIEEKSRIVIVFKSLPIKRQSLIIGKYLFTIVVIIVSSLLSCIFPMIKSFIEKDMSIFYMSFLNAVTYGIFMLAIFLPIYYKHGYMKIQNTYIVIFYGLAVVPLFLNFASNVAFIKPITNIVYVMINTIMQNPSNTIICCAIMYCISMVICMYTEASV